MKILFICKYNVGRSRMAEAFFNKYSKKNRAISGGVSPFTYSHSNYKGVRGTITVMKELGIKIPYKLGKPATKKMVDDADMVVVLLDKKQRRVLPKYVTSSQKTRYNGIPAPTAASSAFIDQQRRNRDMVRKIVLRLVKKFG